MNKYFSILIITLIFFSCKKEEGCMDPTAQNYNSEATSSNESCNYAAIIAGCMDTTAINYNSEASVDNESCIYTSITNLNIHFTQTINGNSLILDSMIYTNQTNTNYSIQRLRYLISDITLYEDNGTSTVIDDVHFIDITIPSSLTLNITEIADNNYTSISFTMGLDSTKNSTDLFLNENFFPSFVWPEFLGGGYHYMQLEGDFNTVFNGYATHTGGTNGIDFSFTKSFPITINETNNVNDIYINMEITNWYENPEIFNFTSDGIMEDPNSQIILQANGIEDVFSINFIIMD